MASANKQGIEPKQPFVLQRAKCGQCGRELRHVPFALNNIMCRDCYGLDRYRRNSPTNWIPERPVEVTISDEEAVTPAAP